MNLNNLAKEITEDEGGKVNLSIAQVKEVLKITLTKLSFLSPNELEGLMKRFRPL